MSKCARQTKGGPAKKKTVEQHSATRGQKHHRVPLTVQLGKSTYWKFESPINE